MSERKEGQSGVPTLPHFGTPQQRYKGTTILRYCNTIRQISDRLATLYGLFCALSRLELCVRMRACVRFASLCLIYSVYYLSISVNSRAFFSRSSRSNDARYVCVTCRLLWPNASDI